MNLNAENASLVDVHRLVLDLLLMLLTLFWYIFPQ